MTALDKAGLVALADRFWRKVDKSGSCWLWTASTNGNGYGQIWLDGKLRPAHRVSLLLAGRPVPTELHVDHLCRTPLCVNPAHLEAVTLAENTRRGLAGYHVKVRAAQLTACKNGHEINATNTYTRKDGRRQCRACKNERDEAKRSANVAAGLTTHGLTRQRMAGRASNV